jgi:hypothetical protein
MRLDQDTHNVIQSNPDVRLSNSNLHGPAKRGLADDPAHGATRQSKLAYAHCCCVFTLNGHDLHRVIDRNMLEVLWHDVDCIWTESKYTADGAMPVQ